MPVEGLGKPISGSKIDGSKIDGSKIDGSKIDGSKIDGSKMDALAVGNKDSLELATLEMVAPSVRSVEGVEKA